MDEKAHLWSGSDKDEDNDNQVNDTNLRKELRKARKGVEQNTNLINADDSNELRSVWLGTDEEKTMWTCSKGDDDDDNILREACLNERSEPYIDKILEFEDMPKYKTFSNLLKYEKEVEELCPGKQVRKVTVENTLKNLKVSNAVAGRTSSFVRKCVLNEESMANIWLLGSHTLCPFTISKMGICGSSYVSRQMDFFVEGVDEGAVPNSKHISEDVEIVCRILTRGPHLSICSSLDQSGVKVSPKLVVEVLKRITNAGKLSLSFFRWAEKQKGFEYSTECYHNLIDALGKIKQFRLIWDLVFVMKEQNFLTKETFALISRRYVRAKNIKEAIETFERMRNFGLKPDISDLNSFLDTLSKSKNVKIAQEIFVDMRNRFSPDIKTYTILLEGWGNMLNLEKMIEVYQEMMNDGFEPDIVSYGILIRGFVKCRKLDEAIRLFKEMVARNIKPSPHIYCTLINGLGSEKRLSEALKYFTLSKASGSPVDIPMYNAVVGSYCWSHQFENAYMILLEMKSSGLGPNARTYEVILHHLIKARRIEEAYQVFLRMGEESGCEPELNTYTMIVRMFCSEERVDMALKVWAQMNDNGVIPCMHMYSVLINGLERQGRLEEACLYFQEMIDRGLRPPGRLYADLKQALLDGGKGDLAMHMGTKLEMLRTNPLTG